MEFSCLQEHFNKGISKAARVISSKPQLPILSSVLLIAEQGSLQVVATNLETTIVTHLPAKILTEGKICLPAKLLTEFVSMLPKDAVSVKVEQDVVHLSCGRTKATIPGSSPSEFPPIPAFSHESGVDIQKQMFFDVISSVIFSAAQDESRPLLTGLRFEKGEEQTTIAATDGYRLSVSGIAGESLISSDSLVIPARALSEVLRICGEEKEYNTMRLTETIDGQLVFSVGDTYITTRRIDGDFPNYKRIIPSSHTTEVIIEKEEIFRAVKSAALFARESSGIIKINVNESVIEISANTPQVGENVIEIDAEVSGEAVSIAMNSRFLLEFIQSLKGEKVIMYLTGALTPVMFKYPENTEYLHIIMPVRVNS